MSQLKYHNGREAKNGDPVIFMGYDGKVKAGVAYSTGAYKYGSDESSVNLYIDVNIPGVLSPCGVWTGEITDKDRLNCFIYHAEDAFREIHSKHNIKKRRK